MHEYTLYNRAALKLYVSYMNDCMCEREMSIREFPQSIVNIKIFNVCVCKMLVIYILYLLYSRKPKERLQAHKPVAI